MFLGSNEIRHWLREEKGSAGARRTLTTKIHEARSDAKRLQAALRLSRPVIPKAEFCARNSQIKEAADLLAVPRDQHVTRKTLIAHTHSAGPDFFAWIDQHIPEPRGKSAAAKQRQCQTAIQRILTHWPEPSRKLGKRAIRRQIRKSWKQACKAFRRARETGGVEQFHQWRKWTKRLLLQLTLAGRIRPVAPERSMKRLEKLQKRLGSIHDMAVAEEFLATQCPARVRRLAQKDLACHRMSLERKALKLGCKALGGDFF